MSKEVDHVEQKGAVLGGNFVRLTAALSVKQELGRDIDVTVVSKADQFTFNSREGGAL
jgi:NADH dehydrogenase FAD-containing subunit